MGERSRSSAAGASGGADAVSQEIAQSQGRRRHSSLLVGATYAVLALPVGVFLLTWCTPWLGITAAAVLVCGARSLPATAPRGRRLSRSSALLAIAVGSLGFCISGAGGVGPQGFDQIKHNAVLADLIAHPWPVLYSPDQPLVYYLAYYLLPALLGKVGGWILANLALAGETWLLYVLAALWVTASAKHTPKASLLVFVFFSGLDPIGNWIVRGSWGYDPWWARLQFSDPAILIISVPQHVAIGWIGAAAVLESDRLREPCLAVLVWSLSPYWSPFVTLGLTPFVLFTWLRHQGFRRHLTLQIAIVLLVLAPAALYFRAASPALETYNWSTMGVSLSVFLLFVFLEWGIYGVLLAALEGRRLFGRSFALLAMVSLAVIPLPSFPGYTDYVARASIPALFFLALQVADSALEGLRRRELRAVGLSGVLLLGALQPLAIYRQSVHHLRAAIPDLRSVPSLPNLGDRTGVRNDGQQYIGQIGSVFFQHLAARHPSKDQAAHASGPSKCWRM